MRRPSRASYPRAFAAARSTNREPTLAPIDALRVYAEARRLPFDDSIRVMEQQDGERDSFSGGTMAKRDIPVSLAWFEHEGQLRLVWDLVGHAAH